jgi:NAD(P)-dependent dehydrogenase (short-subunit alcohol dehydrogenase family)
MVMDASNHPRYVSARRHHKCRPGVPDDIGLINAERNEVQEVIEEKGQHAVSVVCDLSDIASVRTAAGEITELHLPIAGLVNNAGIYQMQATKNALGWDIGALLPRVFEGHNKVTTTASGTTAVRPTVLGPSVSQAFEKIYRGDSSMGPMLPIMLRRGGMLSLLSNILTR